MTQNVYACRQLKQVLEGAAAGLDQRALGLTIAVAGVVEPVVAGVVEPVVAGVVEPVVAGVVEPVVAGVVEPVEAGVVEPVVARVVELVVPKTEALRPHASIIVVPANSGTQVIITIVMAVTLVSQTILDQRLYNMASLDRNANT